jgi:hypothetical protein
MTALSAIARSIATAALRGRRRLAQLAAARLASIAGMTDGCSL